MRTKDAAVAAPSIAMPSFGPHGLQTDKQADGGGRCVPSVLTMLTERMAKSESPSERRF